MKRRRKFQLLIADIRDALADVARENRYADLFHATWELVCFEDELGFAMFRRYGYDYPEFVRRVNAFRDFYGLTSFTYKQLDKFLYYLGYTLPSREQA